MIPKISKNDTSIDQQTWAERGKEMQFAVLAQTSRCKSGLVDVSLLTWKRCLVLLACPFHCFASMFCGVAENCLLDGFLVCLRIQTCTLHTHTNQNATDILACQDAGCVFSRHKAKQQLNQRTLMGSVC